jgi:addiction module HigA family antidote
MAIRSFRNKGLKLFFTTGLRGLSLRIGAMKTYNPPHPGEVLWTICLEPLGLTVTAAAAALGVSRRTLSAIVNGRSRISPEMAVRLSQALDTTAESWLLQQLQYDLWLAEKKRPLLQVKRLSAA